MGDDVHELAADRRRRKLGAIGGVTGFAGYVEFAGQATGVQRFEAEAKLVSRIERGEPVVFDECSTFAVVVIQIPGMSGIEQAAEVVKTMPVVTADTGVKGSRKPGGIDVVINFSEEVFALA